MKRRLSIIGIVGLMLLLQAHEFWLEPMKFKIKPGESTTIKFAVGENFTGDNWDLSNQKVTMSLVETQGTTDLSERVPTVKGTKLKLAFPNPGTKLIAMNGKPSFMKLNGKKFNEYLESDGLDNAIEWRQKNKQDTVGAREFYTRYAKLMIQVGDELDDTWKNIIGHRLEILPTQNPYSLKPGDYLGCKILYQGKASAHTLVKVWGHVGNKIFLQNAYTEDDGTVKFPISANGPWMISAVKMERSKKPDADWESSWASLVFSVE